MPSGPVHHAFVESMGAALTNVGMSRLPSRAFAALLIDPDGRMTAAELGETLVVSPAAVSGAVKYLEQVGLVYRQRAGRRDIFVVDDDTWADSVLRWDKSYAPMVGALSRTLETLPPDDPARRRLWITREYLRFILAEMSQLSDRWRARVRQLEAELRGQAGAQADTAAGSGVDD